MNGQVTLRAWQRRLLNVLRGHQHDDFLLVACPAAGKTIAAAVAAAQQMRERGCDQLVVVCPTVVVKDQWIETLAALGFRMLSDFAERWPAHVHGVCTTYHQVAMRAERFAAACEQRPTVVMLDEIHHAGEHLAWGAALTLAFADARLRLALSGTPFRSDQGRIPFVRYDPAGFSLSDFAYDYPQAVRDGVCRPVRFRAHDGTITWRGSGQQQTARFSEPVSRADAPRRLRAALDPAQPYLHALLAAAHADLLALRVDVPDAGGLVVCDSQAHALAVDRLLTEITGEVPALAISDLPRAHHAIRAFAAEPDPWLVSVRMVSEGVDIPRLGVIAWATAARTELMVRQVAGRALRGRDAESLHSAVVHLPADPRLTRYAARLDTLSGLNPRRGGGGARTPDPRAGADPAAGREVRFIDPAPFVAWFDRQAAAYGARSTLTSIGWSYERGMRRLSSWRAGRERGHVLTLLDACQLAGVDFDTLFAADRYAPARAFATQNGPVTRLDLGAVHAEPSDAEPELITPPLPAARARRARPAAPVRVTAPTLPPSPQELADAERERAGERAELFSALTVYAQLRRRVEPVFGLGAAHAELAAALGAPVTASSPQPLVRRALAWARERTRELAAEHPDAVKALARERRRLNPAA